MTSRIGLEFRKICESIGTDLQKIGNCDSPGFWGFFRIGELG